MIPFHKIVFPVDYTEACKGLVPYVKQMADQYGAAICAVHAYTPPAVLYGYGELAAVDWEWPELEGRERQRLADFTREAFGDRPVQQLVEQGGAAEVICRAVKEHGADLVMMPTRSRGPLRRLILGSVTAKVMHDLHCPVWTGAHDVGDVEYEPRVAYRSILCALGWDDEGAALLRNAAELARSFGAKLTLVHATEIPPPSIGIDIEPYRGQLVEAGRAHIDKLLREAGLSAPTVLIEGPIVAAIRTTAIEHEVDLIVVGRGHAHGWFGTLWSRLYGIVREAPCPVLSI